VEAGSAIFALFSLVPPLPPFSFLFSYSSLFYVPLSGGLEMAIQMLASLPLCRFLTLSDAREDPRSPPSSFPAVAATFLSSS